MLGMLRRPTELQSAIFPQNNYIYSYFFKIRTFVLYFFKIRRIGFRRIGTEPTAIPFSAQSGRYRKGNLSKQTEPSHYPPTVSGYKGQETSTC